MFVLMVGFAYIRHVEASVLKLDCFTKSFLSERFEDCCFILSLETFTRLIPIRLRLFSNSEGSNATLITGWLMNHIYRNSQKCQLYIDTYWP